MTHPENTTQRSKKKKRFKLRTRTLDLRGASTVSCDDVMRVITEFGLKGTRLPCKVQVLVKLGDAWDLHRLNVYARLADLPVRFEQRWFARGAQMICREVSLADLVE